MNTQKIMLAVLLGTSGAAYAQKPIQVKGQVVGMKDSCMVSIMDSENPQEAKRLASTKFVGENFSLSAQLKTTPRMASLVFATKSQKGKWVRQTELSLMLDGSPVNVKIDKELMLADMMWQEKQARINQADGKLVLEAGKAQQGLDDYLGYVRTASITADSASYAEASAWFANNGNDDAIPKVKKMAKDYADKLAVISCSVDEKKEAWLKAEKAEAMPWPQLFLPLSKLKKAAVAYSITSIPRLALIGADGKVICITHSPEEIKKQIIKSQR